MWRTLQATTRLGDQASGARTGGTCHGSQGEGSHAPSFEGGDPEAALCAAGAGAPERPIQGHSATTDCVDQAGAIRRVSLPQWTGT